MARFIILPFMILPATEDPRVEPNVQSFPIVLVMIGNNNMFFTPETGIESAAKGIQTVVANVREKFPQAAVIVAKILPAHAPGHRFYEDIKRTNLALDPLNLDSDPQVQVLDLTADFTNADGSLRKSLFTPDNIHLSPAGYSVYAERLKPLFDRALRGQGLGGDVALPKTADGKGLIYPYAPYSDKHLHLGPSGYEVFAATLKPAVATLLGQQKEPINRKSNTPWLSRVPGPCIGKSRRSSRICGKRGDNATNQSLDRSGRSGRGTSKAPAPLPSFPSRRNRIELPTTFSTKSTCFTEGDTLRYLRPILACVFFCNWIIVSAASAAEGKPGDANADEQAIRQQSQRLVEAYNGGQAKAVAAAFLPEGEAVDDEGNVYQGQEQLEQVFTKFFEAFPGAKMTLSLDSVRVLGPGLAVEDGTRKVVTQDGTGKAATRYTLLHVKRDGQWRIASAREFKADEEPTPHERLLPLAWLVGDWVDENAESVVMMSCRWSEDKNFLLMEYTAKIQGRAAMKTSQRIGWDPLHQRVRSWAFDSDGGYGDAHWTAIDTGWVLKSSAVLPDGQTGSATLFIEPVDKDKFVMRGFDRIVGDQTNDDYEVTIVRRPPAPGK